MLEDDKIRRAWRSYLRETKNLRGIKYTEVEPWAWARLQSRLGKLQVARSRAA